jgi:hypothetical protein
MDQNSYRSRNWYQIFMKSGGDDDWLRSYCQNLPNIHKVYSHPAKYITYNISVHTTRQTSIGATLGRFVWNRAMALVEFSAKNKKMFYVPSHACKTRKCMLWRLNHVFLTIYVVLGEYNDTTRWGIINETTMTICKCCSLITNVKIILLNLYYEIR